MKWPSNCNNPKKLAFLGVLHKNSAILLKNCTFAMIRRGWKGSAGDHVESHLGVLAVEPVIAHQQSVVSIREVGGLSLLLTPMSGPKTLANANTAFKSLHLC